MLPRSAASAASSSRRLVVAASYVHANIGTSAPQTTTMPSRLCSTVAPRVAPRRRSLRRPLVQPRFRKSPALQRQISSTAQVESAVFVGWNTNSIRQDWHRPQTFMADASLAEKEIWLESMMQRHDRHLDVEAFLVVLKALSVSPEASAPRRAERLLHRLNGHPDLEPTTDAYQAVIQAWANSDKEQTVVIVNRAEKWLNELLQKYESSEAANNEHLQPTIELYNAFLDACTRGRMGKNKRDQRILNQNALKADAILRRLHSENHHQVGGAPVAPNTDSFNFVIRGWTRCKHDHIVPNRTLSLLRLMESYQRKDPSNATVRPDSKSYAMTMDALVHRAKTKAMRCMEEGGYSSDTSKNGIYEMDEAEAILKYMHDLHGAGVQDVVPHRVPYNILMGGWAGLSASMHFNAPFKAEAILRGMAAQKDSGFLEAAPDRISFEKVMLAWANSNHPNAGRRAQWWLKKLWNDSERLADKSLLPTTRTYNITMHALGKAEGPLAAENLLLDLGDKYREAPTSTLCPNSESFSIVIKAWQRKANHDKNMDDCIHSLHRAVEWLTSLREVENENSLSTAPELFTGVLRAAKRCARERPEVLELADRTFHALVESRHSTDAVSYALMLEVGLEALSSPEADDARLQFVDDIVRRCCEDGLVGKRFVQSLVNSTVGSTGWTLEECEETKERLFHTWPFPHSWTRNLRSERFYPSRRDLERQTSRPTH